MVFVIYFISAILCFPMMVFSMPFLNGKIKEKSFEGFLKALTYSDILFSIFLSLFPFVNSAIIFLGVIILSSIGIDKCMKKLDVPILK